jgi:hypothetical protein
METMKKQYVICNWNERAFGIVIQLHADVLRLGKEDYPITIIDKKPVATGQLYENYGKYFYNVKFHEGDPSDRTVLTSAGIENAICVIVLGDDSDPGTADARTMLTFLALKKIRDDLSSKEPNYGEYGPAEGRRFSNGIGGFRVLLEFMTDESTKGRFQNILEMEREWVNYLSASVVDSMLFGQSARTPGIVKTFFDILSFSGESAEIYRYDVPKQLLDDVGNGTAITFEDAFKEMVGLKVGGAPLILVGAIKNGHSYVNPSSQSGLMIDENTGLLVMAKGPVALDELLSQKRKGGVA